MVFILLYENHTLKAKVAGYEEEGLFHKIKEIARVVPGVKKVEVELEPFEFMFADPE